MKLQKLTLVYVILLATILVSTGAIIALSAPDIKANVKWVPKTYTWDNLPPDPWSAEVALTGGHKADEIDGTTIWLEGMYLPSGPLYPAPHGPKVMVPFDGWDVKAAIEPKLPWHMGIVMPGRYRIELEITGNTLPEYGGLPFRGIGTITITVPESPG